MRDKIKDGLGDKIKVWDERSARRIYFTVEPNDVYKSVEFIFKSLGLRFSTASGIDLPEGFEILYHFSFDKAGEIYSLRTLIKDKIRPEIDSIAPIFRGAEWVEREIWEMLGINFKGHPNLKRLLLAEDWPEGEFPLRRKNES
ncbi:MAG: NADH-quinone oxidoreductase subunit C [Candidatus Omnitrophica bacterium]|nr:NADH-quinone oxidoreductase subunit C [Candidatus Omnitrophota bacterium]